jgi:hypothetical protein
LDPVLEVQEEPMMEEYVNGRKVRHSHYFSDEPSSWAIGHTGWLKHEHGTTTEHVHPLVETWSEYDIEESQQRDRRWFGPAQSLPELEDGWKLDG